MSEQFLTTSGTQPANLDRQVVSKAERVATSLRGIRETLLAPFDAWQVMRRPFKDPTFTSRMPPSYSGFLDISVTIDHPASEDQRELMLAAMDAKLAVQPSSIDVDRLAGLAQAALSAEFDWKVTRLCVALMIDAFPNARPHSPETYQEALVAQLSAGGYQPAVVAKACDAALRGNTFLPAISEVLEKAEEAQSELAGIVRMLEFYDGARAKFDANRGWLTDIELQNTDRSNSAWPPYRTDRGSRW